MKDIKYLEEIADILIEDLYIYIAMKSKVLELMKQRNIEILCVEGEYRDEAI